MEWTKFANLAFVSHPRPGEVAYLEHAQDGWRWSAHRGSRTLAEGVSAAGSTAEDAVVAAFKFN